MTHTSPRDRLALWTVIAFFFAIVLGATLVAGCNNSSTPAAGIEPDLKWDQGTWDAVKWG